jgi:hypothetical protein
MSYPDQLACHDSFLDTAPAPTAGSDIDSWRRDRSISQLNNSMEKLC